nr:GHKL domain-containing protein [Metabacillus mangrovi]
MEKVLYAGAGVLLLIYYFWLLWSEMPVLVLAAAAGLILYGGTIWIKAIPNVKPAIQILLATVQAAAAAGAWLAPLAVQSVFVLIAIAIEGTRYMAGLEMKKTEQERTRLLEVQDAVNETFRVVRSQRHDYLKHVTAVHFLVESGKEEEAREYMKGLLRSYEETNFSIKGEDGAAAGILHDAYERASRLGVKITYAFDLPVSSLPISPFDLVGLLGNILSNAVEACEEFLESGNSSASLTMKFEKKSGVYILVCENTCVKPPNDVLDVLFEKAGRSTKGQEGLGTKVIADIVRKNAGFLDFACKENRFSLKVKFPAVKKRA